MRGAARNIPWTRRIIYTVIVLAVAGALAWWGSQSEGRRYSAISERIMMMCESLAAGETPTWEYDLVRPEVADEVIRRMQNAVSGLPTDMTEAVRVDVAPTDGGPYDRGEASHKAIIYVYGKPALGLLIETGAAPEQFYITGWWQPEAASP